MQLNDIMYERGVEGERHNINLIILKEEKIINSIPNSIEANRNKYDSVSWHKRLQ